MRNKTQERIEDLARERAARTIDLALVEEGIEIGKQMMAEMIATYSSASSKGASAGVAAARDSAGPADTASDVADPRNGATAATAQEVPGRSYLNEVRPLPPS
jgi:hypothetical protein